MSPTHFTLQVEPLDGRVQAYFLELQDYRVVAFDASSAVTLLYRGLAAYLAQHPTP